MSNTGPNQIIDLLKPEVTYPLDNAQLEGILITANAEFAKIEEKLAAALADGKLSENRDLLFSNMREIIRGLLIFQQQSTAYAFALKYAAAIQQYTIH